MLTEKEILTHVDHTLLTQTSTMEEIKNICDEAVKFNAASVCVPPAYVKVAHDYLGRKIPVCTVIGFPNGYNTLAVKRFETIQAMQDGAREIDMVINIAFLKSGRTDYVKEEISLLRDITKGKILKVIVETCFLTDEEKKLMCDIVAESGADYIKTSTGFGTGNANFHDVELFASCLQDTNVKIKASGGIKNFEDAAEYLRLGADRLGSSSLIKSLL